MTNQVVSKSEAPASNVTTNEPLANGGQLKAAGDRMKTFNSANPALVKAIVKRFPGFLTSNPPSKEEREALAADIFAFMEDATACVLSPSANFRQEKTGINVHGPRMAGAVFSEDKAILKGM